MVDRGLAQRHADGPEIMNSGLRPPASGNFSLGVWENLDAGVYKLNHFGIGWDPSNLSGPLEPWNAPNCPGSMGNTKRFHIFCPGLGERGGSDTTNAPSGIGNPQGATPIVEAVSLSPDGNHYVGTFTLDATDTSGNPTAHIIGVMAGTRVTVETTIPDLL